MIDGIEILSQEIITESTGLGLKIFFIGSVISLVLGILLSVFYFEDPTGIAIGLLGLCLCLAVGVITDNAYQIPTDRYEYKVIIDDNVGLLEFYERYKIIDQEGKIFTIREKEDVDD